MVRLEGNMSLKNPVTPPGIDPGTIRLVAQHLNHYATPGPDALVSCLKKTILQFALKFTCFGAVTPSSGSALICAY
jgi:hypothetical protein